MAKYKNRKITWQGRTFDSRKEFDRYQELLLLQRAGKIRDLQTQVRYELIPNQYGPDGKMVERSVAYKADFVYQDMATGQTVVEDTKGFRTQEYIIKRKLMRYRYGIEIREI